MKNEWSPAVNNKETIFLEPTITLISMPSALDFW
jgi:hypothetical protein